ncbi:MAG: galactokinase [Actinomycetota bacterium]|nr:galactokinase [Actinomycetota bacterium]
MTTISAWAPGRVNVIGDHTDHTGGWCLPMAIDRGVGIDGEAGGDVVHLTSKDQPAAARVRLSVADPRSVQPPWARYVAAVVAEFRPPVGLVGTVSATLPSGIGLSSSAALEVAVALALGADAADPVAFARRCQAAEHAARGVPTGILDQLSSIGGVEGHALLMDCHEVTVAPVQLPPPDEVEWSVVVPSGRRELASSGYAERVAELAVAEDEIGPLRLADRKTVETIRDAVVRRRSRHVVTENGRVHAFAAAIAAGDLATAGALMHESHASLRDDFQSSTTAIDARCVELSATPGVFGARSTGGGWGGAIVVMARPGALAGRNDTLIVRPSAGARSVIS